MSVGKRSRDKGARGELEVCRIYDAHGWPATRNWQSGGQGGSDVIKGPPATVTEVRYRERLELWRSLQEVEQSAVFAPAHALPILAFRRNRSQWYAAIPLEDLCDLLEAAES